MSAPGATRSVGSTGPDSGLALFTDLYELSMLQAYRAEGMDRTAVFSLFVRSLPEDRNFLLAAGLDDALRYLETLRFTEDDRAYLRDQGFDADFCDWLGDLRFEGDVWALPEGTPFFPDEPLVEVEAPLPVAQLAETFVMNRIHHATTVASRAARVVIAADGRPVVDFGVRRMHGVDAGVQASRAQYLAGFAATSNVLAGRLHGLPITGTMAHSYVQAHDLELDAFRAFVRVHPETVLLVDTYDTLEGVRNVVRLARELGDAFRVRAVRLDSGDLAALARDSRAILDEAGLGRVEIFASGGLDEHEIDRLVAAGAPIDGFGVGTSMVPTDAPALDIAYKLVEYDGKGRMKLSTGKRILPGRKQVFRVEEDGRAVRDVVAGRDDDVPGRPLLRRVMAGGKRVGEGTEDLAAARRRAGREIARLPEPARRIPRAEPAYRVAVHDGLRERQASAEARLRGERPPAG